MNPNELPRVLRDLRNRPVWCRWKQVVPANGKPQKRPVDPQGVEASTKNPPPGFLLTLDEAVAAGPSDATQGVGLVLTGGLEVDGGRLVGLDLDGCVDPTTEPTLDSVEPWAREILDHYGPTFVERTPSGCGLRLWLVVAEPGESNAKKIPMPSKAPNVPLQKTAEAQVFGCLDGGQYVTFTGRRLDDTGGEVKTVVDLSWLWRRFRVAEPVPHDAPLPAGRGPIPTIDEIRRGVEKAPHGRELLAGDWQGVVANGQDKSASAAFRRLERLALHAGRGHVSKVLDFLLTTEWASGEVEGSSDPSKYAKRSWVEADLVRAVENGQGPRDPAEVFGPVPIDDAAPEGQPSPGAAPKKRERAFRWIGDLLAEGARIDWLLRDLFPREGVAELFGPKNTGKSAIAVSLVAHVLAGRDWLDRRNKAGPGWCAYIASEGARGIRQRFKVALEQVDLEPAKARLAILEDAVALCERGDVAWLGQRLDELQAAQNGEAPRVVVVDTLAMNFGPGNENAAEDMGRVVAALQAVARTYRTLVLYLHHPPLGEKTRSRGSSVLGGAIDTQLRVGRVPGGVEIIGEKARDAARLKPVRRALEIVTVGTDEDGHPVTTVRLGTGRPTASCGDPLLDFVAENPTASFTDIAKALRIGKSTAERRVNKLVAAGKLRSKSRGEGRGQSWEIVTVFDPIDDAGEGVQE